MGSGGRQADKEGCRRGIRGSICLTAAPPHTQERRGAPLVDLFDVKFSSLMDNNGSGEERLLWSPLRQNLALLAKRHQMFLHGCIQTKSGMDLSNMYRYHSSAPV